MKKSIVSCLVLLLAGIILICGFAMAAGSSFEKAEELKFNEESEASIKTTILAGEEHYYKYLAYSGDEINITFIGISVQERGNFPFYQNLNLKIERYNANRTQNGYNYLISTGNDTARVSFVATYDGERYLKLFIVTDNRYIATAVDYEITIKKQCREGYSNEFRKCENGNWIELKKPGFLNRIFSWVKSIFK